MSRLLLSVADSSVNWSIKYRAGSALGQFWSEQEWHESHHWSECVLPTLRLANPHNDHAPAAMPHGLIRLAQMAMVYDLLGPPGATRLFDDASAFFCGAFCAVRNPSLWAKRSCRDALRNGAFCGRSLWRNGNPDVSPRYLTYQNICPL